jgi:hypothetical protein
MIDTLRRDTSPSLYYTSTGTISKGNKLLGLAEGEEFSWISRSAYIFMQTSLSAKV